MCATFVQRQIDKKYNMRVLKVPFHSPSEPGEKPTAILLKMDGPLPPPFLDDDSRGL